MTGLTARGGLFWFALHEARLTWRDVSWMWTGSRSRRAPFMFVFGLVAVALLHGLAAMTLSQMPNGAPDAGALVIVGGVLLMMFSLMLSQAIESVTRAYFGRSDLDLILSSPASAERLFAVRAGVVGLQTATLSLVVAAPVVNVAAWKGGAGWLMAYPTLFALGFLAAGLAAGATCLMFRTVGARRTRLVAQVMAATVGAGFVIALQAFAILGGQGLSRMAIFSSAPVRAVLPETDAFVMLPARAASGEAFALLATASISFAVFIAIILLASRRFATDAVVATTTGQDRTRRRRFKGFRRSAHLRSQLRRKEWTLLLRDPWLVSQSLQQVLYMLPPALFLYSSFGADRSALFVVVPVVVMAAGQLAGGLAWLAISGEDAHELIVTAPVRSGEVLRAKVEAVAVAVLIALAPLALGAALISLRGALWLLAGGVLAAASATLIQMWFRAQANRSFFRRRQVSSRVATVCEAMVSINWAAVACLAVAGAPAILFALPLAALAMTFGAAWFLRPVQPL